MTSRSRQNRLVAIAAILCALYAVNLWLTNVLRQEAGGVDTIWTANAFVIGAMLLLPRAWRPACLLAGFAIQTVVVFAFTHSMVDALGFSLLNVVEAMAVVALAHRLNAVRLTTPGRFARLIFGALLPVLIASGLLLGLAVLMLYGKFPVDMLISRLAAKFLGMSLVLPAILLLGGASGPTPMRARWWETALAAPLLVGLTSIVFTPLGPAVLLALFPTITLLGLRMGPRAVTVAMGLISAVMLTVILYGGTPAPVLVGQPLGRQINLVQFYLAMVFATGLVTALTATHQHRLRQLLVRRSASYQRARDRAQAASVAKTSFLATMSHEIRTPLNAIIGFAEVLDFRDDLPGESRRQIGLIKRAGNALLTVVNDILDFSKVEADRIDLDPKPVNLTAACRDALAIVADSAARKGLALSMAVEGDLAAAHICDDHRLNQVLLNFLNNAVKFTDAGSVTLTLAVTPGADIDRVRIAIADTGMGIAPDAVARLFQRFNQGDTSISRTHGGTGLGLAICKGLVQAMGGEVGVESAPGVGSTFWLEVPMARADVSLSPDADAADETALAAHILLVDDHPMNRELGVTILELLGCTVDVACDGREAIEAARSRRYDLILMDVHMPGVDGLAATRAIRAMGTAASRTPIIAMSADVLPEQRARMTESGMVDSVSKPVSVQSLGACVARWAGQEVAVETAATTAAA